VAKAGFRELGKRRNHVKAEKKTDSSGDEEALTEGQTDARRFGKGTSHFTSGGREIKSPLLLRNEKITKGDECRTSKPSIEKRDAAPSEFQKPT